MTINELEDITGEGTTLVTLLLPTGYSYRKARNLLTQERSEARNIQSKNTRKKVLAALKKAENELKELGEIPGNGVAIYAKHDESFTHIPEKELNQKLYRCDNQFHTDPILELEKDNSRYGFIQANRERYRVGQADINGNTQIYRTDTSSIPSKHSKGGQSAQRWERYRKEQKKNYVKEVTETAQNLFLKKLRNDKLLGIVIAGTLNKEIKNRLSGELKQKIVAESSETQNLDKLYMDVENQLRSRNVKKFEEAAKQFLNRLDREPYKVEYGEEQVKKAAEIGAVEKLVVPESQYV